METAPAESAATEGSATTVEATSSAMKAATAKAAGPASGKGKNRREAEYDRRKCQESFHDEFSYL